MHSLQVQTRGQPTAKHTSRAPSFSPRALRACPRRFQASPYSGISWQATLKSSTASAVRQRVVIRHGAMQMYNLTGMAKCTSALVGLKGAVTTRGLYGRPGKH